MPKQGPYANPQQLQTSDLPHAQGGMQSIRYPRLLPPDAAPCPAATKGPGLEQYALFGELAQRTGGSSMPSTSGPLAATQSSLVLPPIQVRQGDATTKLSPLALVAGGASHVSAAPGYGPVPFATHSGTREVLEKGKSLSGALTLKYGTTLCKTDYSDVSVDYWPNLVFLDNDEKKFIKQRAYDKLKDAADDYQKGEKLPEAQTAITDILQIMEPLQDKGRATLDSMGFMLLNCKALGEHIGEKIKNPTPRIAPHSEL